MFHPFSLEEVYEYAESMGYSREDVDIERVCSRYDYDLEQEVDWEYHVSFGYECGPLWFWIFHDLGGIAVDYEYEGECED